MTGLETPGPGRSGRRVTLPALRAAIWSTRAFLSARRQLSRTGVRTSLPEPPRLPWSATRGVTAALRRWGPTCLERALVLQAWLASQGRRHDVVLGVAQPGKHFRAHAWLDGLEPPPAAFRELHRLPPPERQPAAESRR